MPTAQEVTERDVLATGVKPGTPKFQKVREETDSDASWTRVPRKIPPPEETPVRARWPWAAPAVQGGRQPRSGSPAGDGAKVM